MSLRRSARKIYPQWLFAFFFFFVHDFPPTTRPFTAYTRMEVIGKRKADSQICPACFYANRTDTSVEQEVIAMKRCTRAQDNYWDVGKIWVEPDAVADAYKVWWLYTGYDWPDVVPVNLIKKVKSAPEIDDRNLFDTDLAGKDVMVKSKLKHFWESGIITGSHKKRYIVCTTDKRRHLTDKPFNSHDIMLVVQW